MFHPRVPLRTLAPILALMLLLAGCIMPARQDEAPVPPPAEPAPAEVAETRVEEVAEPAPVLTVAVTTDANVRAGPGTDHAARFWLSTDTEVAVTGRNADGTWLQIEHGERVGWIFGALTDIGAEALAALPDTMPTDMMAAEPEKPAKPTPEPAAVTEPTPEPTPEPTEELTVEPTVAPTPEPEPQTEAPERVTATVTGTVVNLRTGPGTDYPTDGQVREGDRLQVTGRNADGSWLQIMHPAAIGEHVWIYGSLTDIDAATVQTLGVVAMVEAPPIAEPETQDTPEPAQEPTQETRAAPSSATSTPVAGCTQWHTVNANETRLQQITDWYGLDLATVATLNGLDANAPLTAGSQICLSASNQVQPQAPVSTQEPTEEPAPGSLVFPVHPLSIDVAGFQACTIRTDGSAACWKAFEHGQTETPPGIYSQVKVGGDFVCALRNDATVHCWGDIPEAPPGRYVELIAGNTHACGLTSRGHIDCWGENFHNQATPPSGSFRSLGDGDLHSCAIQTDEKVVCWGLVDSSDKPPNKRFQSISGGANYTCGLLRNGELECWGTYTRPVTPPRGKFTSFATGTYHACALRSNGEMVCWGDNEEGEGSPPPGTWKAVACGFYETCGVRIDGMMQCWGMGW